MLELGGEWWYVRAAVPEGCDGGLHRVWQSGGCRGGGPKSSATVRALTSCRASDEVVINVGHRRVKRGTWHLAHGQRNACFIICAGEFLPAPLIAVPASSLRQQ